MKSALAVIKWVILATIGICLAFLAVMASDYLYDKSYQPTSRVLVTAAHLGDIDGYTCVYSDAASDVGIYLQEDYKASAPCIGAEVYFLDHKGWIREVSAGEFAMEPERNEQIVPGVSGTPVYFKGKPVGYISGWNGHGLVRCIFY